MRLLTLMSDIETHNPGDGSIPLGTMTLARNMERPFAIEADDLNEHFYVIGRSGSGKSNFLKELAIADMNRGAGLCFIDPIGDTAEELLTHIPHGKAYAASGANKHAGASSGATRRAEARGSVAGRDKDVIYIDAGDVDFPVGINALYGIAPEDRPRTVSDILQMFEGIWHESGWGARMESIFRASLHTLVSNPHCMRPSLLTVFRLLLDGEFRAKTREAITNPQLRDWWQYRFDRGDLNERTRREWVEPVLNKIDTLSLDPLIRNIIGQPRCKLDFEEVVRKRQILIVNLNQNKVGFDNASFIGMLILSRIRQAAVKAGTRDAPFALTIDEAHSFPTTELARIITQGKHMGLHARIGHQHLAQFSGEVASALRNGCGALAVFAVGNKDAELIVDDLDATHRDRMVSMIRNLGSGETVLRLTRNGAPQPPEPNPLRVTYRGKGSTDPASAIRFTRERYATERLTAEFQILESQNVLGREEHLAWKGPLRRERRQRHRTHQHNRQKKTHRRNTNNTPLGDHIFGKRVNPYAS